MFGWQGFYVIFEKLQVLDCLIGNLLLRQVLTKKL